MASRFLIQKAMALGKRLGINPNQFLGTRSNVSFMGKGPQNNFFNININENAVGMVPKEEMLSELNKSFGYLTGNKLNDIQVNKLIANMEKIDRVWNPPQIANITDMATRTGDLTPGGLEYLKRTGKAGAAQTTKNLEPLGPGYMDETSTGLMTRISDRMKKIKEMSDELGEMGKGDVRPTYEFIDPTAPKASYASKFNPKNEIHVQKADALLRDAQVKGLYTEAEVKNAYDFEGLYQNHFDKGHVDVAQLFEQAGHNIPQMRAAARDALLQLMKKERGRPGLEYGLRDFVEQADFKFISEGGGGRAGDPINLMVKYFGKNVTENLPKNATKENIDKFADFVISAKDSQGRGIRDPFFDRESIDFSEFAGYLDDLPPFKTGGRVGMQMGGLGEILQVPRTGYSKGRLVKGALAILNRNKKNAEYMFKASDNVSPGYAHGDIKYNAELLADQLAEDAGVVLDDLDDLTRTEFYGTAYDYLAKEMGKIRGIKSLTKPKMTGDENLDYDWVETPKGWVKKAGSEGAFSRFGEKNKEFIDRSFLLNREMIRNKYQGLIDDDLLNKILVDDNPQRIAEILATIDEALLMQNVKGMGPEAIMTALRDSWGRKKSASGGLAKILEV